MGVAGLLGIVVYITSSPNSDPIVSNNLPPAVSSRAAPAPRIPTADTNRRTKRNSSTPASGDSEYITTRTGQIMLKLLPAGTFEMGSPDGNNNARSNEKPQHRVWITKPFYLGVYEVTRGQFRQFVDDAGYQTEAEKDGKLFWIPDEETKKKFGPNYRFTWKTPGFDQTDEHPVVNVSWNDAQAFIGWLSRSEKTT